MNCVPSQVVVIDHNGAPQCVYDRALLPFDVEQDSGLILAIRGIVRNRQKRTAERIEVSGREGIGVRGSLGRRSLLPRAKGPRGSLRVPGGQIIARWEEFEERAHVRIASRVRLEHRIVDGPRILAPGIEDTLLVGLIRMDGGDDASQRVVTKDRADPRGNGEFELASRAKEWFILANRFAFVIENGPPAADPTRVHNLPAIQ